jgi:hypothetical protein
MASQPALTQIRTQIGLELELKRTKEELNFVRKRRQRDQESFARQQQAAEDEISELRARLREMQKSTEYYEDLARSYISQNIILQEAANSKKKFASGMPSTATKEREHSTKPVQSFPPSKNPRPLSLTLRPATANKGSSTPPRKLSASTLQETSTLRPPISASSSSRLGSPDNSHASSENPVVVHSAHKSASRKFRSDSAESNDFSSGQPVLASSPPKPTGRNNWMPKLSNPFQRKQHRDDSSREIQPVPILPPLEASVPLDRQMARVLVGGDKRLTNDSGYGSLRFETSSRASMANAE